MPALYSVDEKISWKHENGLDFGIVQKVHPWKETYTYLIKDRVPHKWVAEEQTTKYMLNNEVGYEDFFGDDKK